MSRSYYNKQAPALFEKYGGGQWASVILDNGFESAMHFGDFGYGIVVVDAEGIVRAICPTDIEEAVEEVMGE